METRYEKQSNFFVNLKIADTRCFCQTLKSSHFIAIREFGLYQQFLIPIDQSSQAFSIIKQQAGS